VVTRNGELYTLDIGASGIHAVSIGYTANLAPVISTLGGGVSASITLAENIAAVTTIKASDANIALGDTVTYSLLASGDSALFAINAATGALSFKAAPDFENAADANRDNVYLITVAATDQRGMFDTQALSVRVTNVQGVNRVGTLFNDRMDGTSENDTLNGSWGNDTIYGLGSDDLLYGNLGNDTIFGGLGQDRLYGDSGNDQLDGGEGNDQLFGGAGQDVMIGGLGADTFVFKAVSESSKSSSTRDVIRDFQSGIDRLDLSAIDANPLASGNQAFGFLAAPSTAFTASSQVHYFYQYVGGVEYTVVEGRTSGSGASFSIGLLGHINLSAADFIL
jgi:Ca2+-binding RTX toxin-like protein